MFGNQEPLLSRKQRQSVKARTSMKTKPGRDLLARLKMVVVTTTLTATSDYTVVGRLTSS